MVSRSLRRLWLTELSPPNVCVIRVLDVDMSCLPPLSVKPPFWLGVWLLLLLLPCVVMSVPHGPDVTTALVRPFFNCDARRSLVKVFIKPLLLLLLLQLLLLLLLILLLLLLLLLLLTGLAGAPLGLVLSLAFFRGRYL